MIRMDLTTQAIEVERNYETSPLVILITRDNIAPPAPGGFDDVTCLFRPSANNPWVRVGSGIGAITQGFRGNRHRVQEYSLTEEGEYHVRSFNEVDDQLREFRFNLRLGERPDCMDLDVFVMEAPNRSIWIFEDEDPIWFDGSAIVFHTSLPIIANERTQTVYTPTVETDLDRPTAWDRLGDLDDES